MPAPRPVDLSVLKAAITPDWTNVPARQLLMFYGNTGSGKTKLAIEVAADITPLDKRILYVDTSAGYEILANHDDLANRIEGRLNIIPYRGENWLNTLAGAIRDDQAGFGIMGTVILDEGSTMGQSYLDTVVHGRSLKDEGKEEDFATKPDYAIAGNKLRKTIMNFQNISGVNLIVLAHQRQDEILGKKKVSPAFQPSVGEDIRREMRVVAHCRRTDVDGHVAQVQEDDFCVAKTRIHYRGSPMPKVVTHNILQAAIREHVEKISSKESNNVAV